MPRAGGEWDNTLTHDEVDLSKLKIAFNPQFADELIKEIK